MELTQKVIQINKRAKDNIEIESSNISVEEIYKLLEDLKNENTELKKMIEDNNNEIKSMQKNIQQILYSIPVSSPSNPFGSSRDVYYNANNTMYSGSMERLEIPDISIDSNTFENMKINGYITETQ